MVLREKHRLDAHILLVTQPARPRREAPIQARTRAEDALHIIVRMASYTSAVQRDLEAGSRIPLDAERMTRTVFEVRQLDRRRDVAAATIGHEREVIRLRVPEVQVLIGVELHPERRHHPGKSHAFPRAPRLQAWM